MAGEDSATGPAPAAAGTGRRRRATMAQDALSELRQQIVLGEIRPGSALRLEELAQELQMSISPIREAIRQLETLGLAEHVPYKGARVTRPTLEELEDVYEARLGLEALAVRRAAHRFSANDERAGRLALADLDAAYERDDVIGIVQGNSSFHRVLAAASGSRWLDRLLAPLLETSERYAAGLLRGNPAAHPRRVEADGHRTILEACVAHDVPAAELALREHLGVFARLSTASIAAAEPPRGATVGVVSRFDI
jgi:DNA-binding GntR family transcriptional regulator